MGLQLPQAKPAHHAGEVLSRSPQGQVPGLYIHVPFCFHKCHYCDFYSIVDTQDRQEAFVARLEAELRAIAPWARRPLQTIFVGGGTPSLLRVELWTRLLRCLETEFDLSEIRSGRGEFTVECNPETVTDALADVLVAGGVDRVSMGAQSFDPEHLRTLERWHDPASVPRALSIVERAGIRRRSIDLIFGIPGQTAAQWDAELERVLELGLTHASCYNLTFEPGTALFAREARGLVRRADEDVEAVMFEQTPRVLARGGLARYEVSNFAVPGQECRHNLAYWRQDQWLAAGPSASAHVAGWRWKNTPRLDDYLRPGPSGFSTIVDPEGPDPARALSEWVMTGLRLSEGLDTSVLLRRAGELGPLAPGRLTRAIARARDAGHLIETGGRCVLTEPGLLVSQRVIVDFMRAIDAG